MVLVAVNFHAPSHFNNLPVDTHIEITFLAHRLKEFAIMSLAVSNQRSENVDAMTGVVGVYHVEHALLGVSHHLLACHITICCSGTSVKQSQEVVNFSCCAHSRAWVLVGCFLLDADYRA